MLDISGWEYLDLAQKVKVTLTGGQITEALRLYAMALTGFQSDTKETIMIDPIKWEAVITMLGPNVPIPKFPVKEITQEQVDGVYLPIAQKNLDVS